MNSLPRILTVTPVDGFKGSLCQIESPRTLTMQEGIGVFVQAVRSHALRRAPKAGAIGADRDLLMADGGEDDAIAERLADQGFRIPILCPRAMPARADNRASTGLRQREQSRCIAPPAQNRPFR